MLLDRFVDSSLAYQGGGRELGVEEIRALNAFGTGGLTPDRTLLLRIAPEHGLARIAGGEPDRLEQAGGEFFARVAQTYDELAAAEPERFVVLDATQPPDTVLADRPRSPDDEARPRPPVPSLRRPRQRRPEARRAPRPLARVRPGGERSR